MTPEPSKPAWKDARVEAPPKDTSIFIYRCPYSMGLARYRKSIGKYVEVSIWQHEATFTHWMPIPPLPQENEGQ